MQGDRGLACTLLFGLLVAGQNQEGDSIMLWTVLVILLVLVADRLALARWRGAHPSAAGSRRGGADHQFGDRATGSLDVDGF